MLLAGCSGPSASDAERVLREEIETVSHGSIKLLSFKKTDGQAGEAFGVKGYKLDFEAVIQSQAQGIWQSDDGTGKLAFGWTDQDKAFSSGLMSQLLNQFGGKPLEKGDRAKITGVMVGEKKESGWKFKRTEGRFMTVL